MHGDMGDGDDDPPPPPPPPPPAVLLLMMMIMMMALATAPLFKLSAAAEQQTEQSQRAARETFTARCCCNRNGHHALPTRQNTNRTSTELRKTIDRTSIELRRFNDRISGFFIHAPHSLLTSASFNLDVFFFGVLGFFFFLAPPTRQNTNRILTALAFLGFIHPPHTLSSYLHHLSIWVFLSWGLFFSFLFFFFLFLGEGRFFFRYGGNLFYFWIF
jgi:hypothetical protein